MAESQQVRRHRLRLTAPVWLRKPAGRLALTAALFTALVTAAALGGAYGVPAAARSMPKAATTTQPPTPNTANQAAGDAPGLPLPGPSVSAGELPSWAPGVGATYSPMPTIAPSAPAGGMSIARPSDALAGWAIPLGPKLGIPAVALQAYGYAELVMTSTAPNCHLTWTTLAALGKVESDHGRTEGSTLNPDGTTQPPIIGIALDGQQGHDAIKDTDGGRLDNDPVWDRAVGPMQFIPSTWAKYATDADGDGVANPNDIDDAALAAAAYLCSGGRDLATATGWNAAIMSYNAVHAYVNDVYAAADYYGNHSRQS